MNMHDQDQAARDKIEDDYLCCPCGVVIGLNDSVIEPYVFCSKKCMAEYILKEGLTPVFESWKDLDSQPVLMVTPLGNCSERDLYVHAKGKKKGGETPWRFL